MLSIDSLHGVQLATDCRPGALSPLLKSFRWFDTEDAMDVLGRNYVRHLSPHMSLFVGREVEALHAQVLSAESMAYKAAIFSSIQRSDASLKELTLLGGDFLDRCFQSFAWKGLERLVLHIPSIACLPILAMLPRLSKLHFLNPLSDDVSPSEASRVACTSISNAFPSLTSLRVVSTTRDIHRILSHLPSNTSLKSMAWHDYWPEISVAEYLCFIEDFESHSDHTSLNHLEISSISVFAEEEPVNMVTAQIELSPLFAFNALQALDILVSHSVLVTPDIISKVPDVWPQLRRLVLAPSRSISYLPVVDHTHVLSLLQRLPQLTELGLRFDASHITGQERIIGGPHKLRVLRVGRSPICSATAVVAFLQFNLPRLALLDIDCEVNPEDMILFKKRWGAVLEGWKEVRNR